MPKLIFATVGTSAVENCLKKYPVHKKTKSTLTESVAAELEKNPAEEHKLLLDWSPKGDPEKSSIVYNLRANLPMFEKNIHKRNMATFATSVSAEVASLLVMSKENDIGEFDQDDEICLIPSGTPIGIVCAEANRMVLQDRFKNAKFVCTDPLEGVVFAAWPGKGTEAHNVFLSTGVDKFEEVIRQKKMEFENIHKNNYYSYLDVTGGFKGLILFSPFLCLRYVDALIYFYQEASRPVILNDDYFYGRFKDKNKSLHPEKDEMRILKKSMPPLGDR